MMKKKSKDASDQKGDTNEDTGRLNIKSVRIADIVVADDFRELDTQTVANLAASFQEVGMMHPPAVYPEKKKGWGKPKYTFHLVTGRHRVEAAKTLGWDSIQVLLVESGKSENRRRQITENLHRAELTQREIAKQTKEWVEKCAEEGRKVSHPQPLDKGVSRAAKQLEKSEKAVRLDLEKDKITDDAWAELEKVGLAENQSVALKVAKMPPKKQVAGIQAIVEQRKKRQKDKALKKFNAKNSTKEKAASSKNDAVTEDWDDNSFDKLAAAWVNSSVLREAWAYASAEDRKRFVDEVLFADDDSEESGLVS